MKMLYMKVHNTEKGGSQRRDLINTHIKSTDCPFVEFVAKRAQCTVYWNTCAPVLFVFGVLHNSEP